MSDWDQFGDPTSGPGFKSLEKDGDEIIGTIMKVGKHDPFGDGDVPRLYLTEGGEDFHYDATLVWVRNALLRERPEPGTRIRLWRGPKKGAQVTGGVEILGDSGLAKPKAEPKTERQAPPAKPAADDLPPF